MEKISELDLQIEQAMKSYPTNLTDSQWQCIEKILNDKRKRKICLRIVWNGILYLVRSGCHRGMQPKCFGCWVTVSYLDVNRRLAELAG